MNKPIILVFVPILIAGCTFFLNTEEKRSQMEKVKINVDVIKSLGELPRDVAGIMTDPPRPQWLQDHLLSTGLFGDKEAIEFFAGGANHMWLPVLKPTFTNLGWGGDTWILFDTWPAEGEYNWVELDAWIESHKARGIQEISLVFSAVPEWLWSSENENAMEESGVALNIFPYLKKGHVLPPSNYEKYAEVIYQTVRHLNVEKQFGIKFTVWNEPNVKFWQGTQDEFLKISEITALAVKRADPATMVGGPATAGFNPDWIRVFLKHFADNDLPLDFISWHHYLYYSKLMYKNGRSQQQFYSFKEQLDKLKEILDDYPEVGEPELYITEWAYDWKPSDVSLIFNGAYVAQSIYEMMQGGVDGATYCGILGLLESPDPAADVFKFFHKLEDNRLETAVERDNSSINCLASGRSERITLMVWDFPGYEEPDEPKENSIVIDLENLASGSYRYHRYLIDSNHLEMKTQHLAEDKEIVSDGNVTLEFELQPYAITLIELTRK
jgi:hypothetical protein